MSEPPARGPAPPEREIELQDLQTRIVSWHTIGGTHPDAEQRMVGVNLKNLGWHGYVDRYVVPQIDGGVRRFMLHNPFGIVPGEPMSFDQFVEAREAGMLWLTRGFAEAWRPVVEGAFSDGEPVEVIAYLGAIDTDASMLNVRGQAGAWLRRVHQSIGPALDAGMSIAFDSANDLPADSCEYQLIKLLNALGVRTYVEPRPVLAAPHLHRSNVVSTMQHWRRSDPDRYPVRHMAANDELTGEIVVLVRGIRDLDERRRVTKEWLADDTVTLAVPLRDVVSGRRSLQQWVRLGDVSR